MVSKAKVWGIPGIGIAMSTEIQVERVRIGGRCWVVGSLAVEVGLPSMIRTLDFIPLAGSRHRGILSEKGACDASYSFLRGPDTVSHPIHQKQT